MDISPGEDVQVWHADHLGDAAPFPSFAEYVDRCLYDPSFGYYSTGKVELSPGGHFGTYPQLLRPMFGHILAEAARELFDALETTAAVPEDATFTILELGGGDGTLAEQTLDYVASRADRPRWRPIADRFQYVVGEMSPALRDRQRDKIESHARAGRAAVRPIDARDIDWDGAFYGLVVANELVDVFPCERLRLYGPERTARVHVVPIVASSVASEYGLETAGVAFADQLAQCEVALTGESFWTLLAAGSEDVIEGIRFAELEVPLSMGWLDDDGIAATPPAAIETYLASMDALLGDLRTCGRLPVDLHASPALPEFVTGLADLLTGPNRAGGALLIDYGGPTRYVLDPEASGAHVRVYGPETSFAHSDAVYRDPSEYDITWDVDFTELSRLADERGLATLWFGHQSALAIPLRVQGLDESVAELRAAIEAGGIDDPDVAAAMAAQRIAFFREAAGFRAVILGSGALEYPGWFGPSDAIQQGDLRTLSVRVPHEELESALEAADLPGKIAEHLHPCGDIVADLCDAGYYQQRHEVLTLLDGEGWLVAPGELSR